MLVSLFNANDLIGCGAFLMEGVDGGEYHWLPLVTIDLVGDNRKLKV